MSIDRRKKTLEKKGLEWTPYLWMNKSNNSSIYPEDESRQRKRMHAIRSSII